METDAYKIQEAQKPRVVWMACCTASCDWSQSCKYWSFGRPMKTFGVANSPIERKLVVAHNPRWTKIRLWVYRPADKHTLGMHKSNSRKLWLCAQTQIRKNTLAWWHQMADLCKKIATQKKIKQLKTVPHRGENEARKRGLGVSSGDVSNRDQRQIQGPKGDIKFMLVFDLHTHLSWLNSKLSPQPPPKKTGQKPLGTRGPKGNFGLFGISSPQDDWSGGALGSIRWGLGEQYSPRKKHAATRNGKVNICLWLKLTKHSGKFQTLRENSGERWCTMSNTPRSNPAAMLLNT